MAKNINSAAVTGNAHLSAICVKQHIGFQRNLSALIVPGKVDFNHFVLQSFSISFSSATMISALLRHRLAWRSSPQMSNLCRTLSHSLSDLFASSSLPMARSIQSAGPHL